MYRVLVVKRLGFQCHSRGATAMQPRNPWRGFSAEVPVREKNVVTQLWSGTKDNSQAILAVLGILGVVATCGGAYVGGKKDINMQAVIHERDMANQAVIHEKDMAHQKELLEMTQKYLQAYTNQEVTDHTLAFLAEGEYELLRKVKANRLKQVQEAKSAAPSGDKSAPQ